MRSCLLVIVAILVNFTYSYAQKDAELRIALSNMNAATVALDAQAILNTASPRLIKLIGGKANTLKLITKSLERIKQENLKADSIVNYTDTDILKVKNIKYCFIPQVIVLNIPDGNKKMIRHTTIMAINEPSVKGWTFLNYSDINDEKMKILFPELLGKLSFPRQDIKPLIVPNEEVSSSIDYLIKTIDESMKKIKSVAAK